MADRDLKDIVERRISLFQKKPEAAIYRPKVSSKHIRGLYTETTAREHLVKSDYAEPAGGSNLGPNPIEMLLAAFAACIEASFYEFAVYEGITVTSLSAEVEGTLDLRGLFMVGDVKAGFSDLKYTLKVKSPDDEEKVRSLAEKVIAHCPVVDSLLNPTNITGKVSVGRH